MTERQKYSGTAEEKEFIALLEDKIRLVQKINQPQVMNFLDPRLQSLAEQILNKNDDLAWDLQGGVPGAERQRLIIGPADWELSEQDARITLLASQGNVGQQGIKAINHRDYLGAILGTGIRREKLGDIWLTPAGCVLAVDQDLATYLQQQLIRVKGNVLDLQILAAGTFLPPEKEVCTLETTVASLRLDAVAAAAFRTSRSRITGEIAAGKFSVNWQEVTRLDFNLKTGDVVSSRGRGRIVLKYVKGNTAKGRVKIGIEKYI